MELNSVSLKDTRVMVIFAYSPAGLGHLRVTDALYEGLPSGLTPVLLGSQDKSITLIHRLVSLHPLIRSLFEWGQSPGLQERFFTYFYRSGLRWGTKLLYRQLVTLLEQRLERPKTLVIVATHFGLAHQVAAIKERFMKEQKVRLYLTVVVTDDSPQFIWYVPGADTIFVPSQYTKNKLERYGKPKLGAVRFVVNPYPVSPTLSRDLTAHKWEERLEQFNEEAKTAFYLALPVSGAAIGMVFFVKLIDSLYESCPRVVFHIIAKTSLYTLPYLHDLMSRPYVKIHLAASDRDVVTLYEAVYREYNFGLEITKPSEQAFKALINVNKVGGSLLLFAEPVGRQEIDNLNFLVKHQLIPNLTEQKYLWALSEKGAKLEKEEILQKAKNWRGLVLPHHALKSARFISWCRHVGLFRVMIRHIRKVSYSQEYQNEVNPQGVARFWEEVVSQVKQHN